MDTGVKKAEGIAEKQYLFSLGNIFFLEDLRSGEEGVIRPTVFQIGMTIDERSDIHGHNVHMRVRVFPPELLVILVEGSLEGFTRHRSILLADIQEKG
jgi:hypothetical protein